MQQNNITQYKIQIEQQKKFQINNTMASYQQQRPSRLSNQYNDDQEGQQQPVLNNQQTSQQLQRYKIIVIALIIFCLVLAGILVYREMKNANLVKSANFCENQMLGYQLDPFWKMTAKQLQEQQADTKKKILDSTQHAITRQQLGHNSWTLLHMVTGAFPDQINETLVKKFNAFLVLFGQMYPCKLCANHFMQLLKEVGQFKGNTKKQLMTYLCNIHNRVNKRLGKPIHSCQNIVQQWNTCGCSGGRL